jgi:hypothetical protein
MWIAEQADRIGMSRLLQVPILIATFMFGPIGLLIYFASRATLRLLPSTARS